MAKFLSQDWFNQVNDLTAQAGDLNLPPAIKNLSINLNVTDNNETIGASFYDGVIHQGTKDGALTTLNLDTNTLKKSIF